MSFENYLLTESLTKRFHDKIIKSRVLGADGISTKKFEETLDTEIALIQRKVSNLSYRFSRFNEKLILKNKFSPPRAVYIPTVRDRLVLNALNSYLGEKFQEDLKPYQLTVKDNVAEIVKTLESEQFDAFIKLDVENFFPSLDHEILMKKLQARIEDKTALSLIKKILNRSEQGIAQGLSISSQLAAIYLNEIDKSLKHRSELKYFRFVDDILILCKHSDVDAIHKEIKQKMDDIKLDLHATKVGGKSEYGVLGKDTLEYLGFSFLGDKISVRESSVERLRKRIRKLFIDISMKLERLSAATESEEIQAKQRDRFYQILNLKITGCMYEGKKYGWLLFFKDINDLTLLHHLDWFVKKCFSDFDMEYDSNKIKSFVTTHFKLKNLNPDKLDNNSYIPSFSSAMSWKQLISLGDSTELEKPEKPDEPEKLEVLEELEEDIKLEEIVEIVRGEKPDNSEYYEVKDLEKCYLNLHSFTL